MTTTPAHAIVAATYNIHYSIGTDRRFAPARIAELIASLNADVVALQEVGWHYRGRAGIDQFELLGHLTGLTVHPGLTRKHRYAHFGNAILSRLPAHHVRTLDLSARFREENTGREYELTLAYPKDANADAGRVSIFSPAGSALLGLAVGQAIDWKTPDGNAIRLKVLGVSWQPEAHGEFDL